MIENEWQDYLSEEPVALDMADDVVPSAVLVIISADKAPALVLTKRSAHLKKHAGQISFPGGRVDRQDETLAHTALREAEEEIGLRRETVEIMGYLPDILTGTGFRITPVVAQSSLDQRQLSAQLQANPDEVDSILFAPLSLLLDANKYESFRREDKDVAWRSWRIMHEGHIIWGATAAILHKWANRLS